MTFDVFEEGRVIYHVEPTILETDKVVDNGLHEVYVNTAVKDDSKVSELMQCFLQTEVDNEKFPKLSQKVKYLKHNEEGVKSMCEISDEIRAESIAEGKEELLKLFLKKFSIEDIVELGFDRGYLMKIASNI